METAQTLDPKLPSPRLSCRLDEIDVSGLLREDLGDIQELVDSIKQNLDEGLPGLIHPVVLDSNMRLLSGSRRLAAHRELKLETIDFIFYGLLDEATKVRIEVDANKQKNLNWKETVLGIDKFHRFYTNQAALKGESWGVRETGRLLNWSKSPINRATLLAPYLHANDPQITKAVTLKEAWEIIFKRREDELSKALVASSTPKAVVVALKKEVKDIGDEEFFSSVGTTGFAPGIGGLVDTDENPGQTQANKNTDIPLSKMFFHADAVAWCKAAQAETFDAVITDWPYGIDMDNIQQDGGGKSIDTTRSEHDVVNNQQLQRDIIPELFRIIRTNGWFITWTDMEGWERQATTARDAGFKVQSWPLVWHKTSACQNMAAQYNWTKNFEVALVCRKGNATLLRPQASSVWSGGNEAESKALGHPFAKPFALWEWVYSATCLRGASVLDPFVGCGSSVIPAIRFGLRPTGVEVNEKHYNSLHTNLQNFYKSLDPTCTFS